MVEWFKAHAWKACELRGSAGSNPVLCAKNENTLVFFFICRAGFRRLSSANNFIVGTFVGSRDPVLLSQSTRQICFAH